MFVDNIKIYLKAGDGGKGSKHFRREKFIPKGGPDGGDGGNGGSIYFQGDENLHTLLHLKYKKIVKTENGHNGAENCKHGRRGKDLILKLPLGSEIRDEKTNLVIGEITSHDQKLMIAKGGIGGKGNTHFKSSTNQTPRYAQQGKPGEEKNIFIELKILADIGLVGLPNAGKSSLLASMSAAKPKIANYEFTTLIPSVGIVNYHDDQSFVMADIPGIIEGASQGKGLGIKFLKHIERNAILLLLIDGTSDSIKSTYELLIEELKNFNPQLLKKKRFLAISKSDLLDKELIEEIKNKDLPKDIDYLFISSLTNKNLNKLKDKLYHLLKIN